MTIGIDDTHIVADKANLLGIFGMQFENHNGNGLAYIIPPFRDIYSEYVQQGRYAKNFHSLSLTLLLLF